MSGGSPCGESCGRSPGVADRLAPGDRVVLFSDGITEAMDPEGEEFGENRVRVVLASAAGQPPDGMLQALLDAVRVFTGGATQHDDLTAMAVQYDGRG